jgi:Zn-finger nucleic acid-binding protein
MKCPRDGTVLQRVHTNGLELDKCHKCDGLWFDKGELEDLRAKDVADVEAVLEDLYGSPDYVPGKTEGFMKCPRCDGRLRSHLYTYIDPVKIDSCETCFGMWLDDGELDKILQENKGLQNAAAAKNPKTMLSALANLIRKAVERSE